jgi:hypothetical protein
LTKLLASTEDAVETVRVGDTRLPLMGTGRVYVCGITPYDTTHLGHVATFVWADMAARILRLTGHPVEVCRNITDVDDHLLLHAKVEGVLWKSLAAQQSYRTTWISWVSHVRHSSPAAMTTSTASSVWLPNSWPEVSAMNEMARCTSGVMGSLRR